MGKTTQPRIRLALIDEHPVTRKGMVSSLSAHAGFTVVSETSTVDGVLRDAKKGLPDVVLLDVHSIADAARELRARLPDSKIIVFASTSSDDAVRKAVGAGVRGYVLKTSELEEVIRAIEIVHAGDAYFSPRVAEAFVRLNQSQPSGLAKLSSREREVLALVASGHTSRDIAIRLGLSVRTVESHREHIMQKLEIHTIAGLTRFAVANDLVAPGS